MPELPEVEITVRTLKKYIIKQKICDVTIFNANLRYKIPSNLPKLLKNQTIDKIERRSKFILFKTNRNTILSHLGMTGRYIVKKKSLKLDTSFYNKQNIIKKHNHLLIQFKKFSIIYNDIRKFGFMKIYKNNTRFSKHLINLGPEPLRKLFNYKYFDRKIKKRKLSIKNLLMDQKFVSGLGNIYVNEILFASRINPNTSCLKLKKSQILRILKFTKLILQSSIKKGGSTILNYHNSEGRMGSYQSEFKVYNRANNFCHTPGCNKKIIMNIVSGRSQFYCPKCQKL